MTRLARVPQSELIAGFRWLGERLPYREAEIKGDTFPMTWAENDLIYTSSGDPLWGESKSGLDVQSFTGSPDDYRVTKVNHMNDYLGWGGHGPKPTGMICAEGILYLAFQNLLGARTPQYGVLSQHGSDAQIVYSTTKGANWIPAIGTLTEPMFPGNRFGGPAFVNYGQDNANARDEFVYAVSSDQWDNGSNLRLGRVAADSIPHQNRWEWVAAFTVSGDPVWTRDLADAIPVLSLHRHIGAAEMVYLESIKRYLFLTFHLRKDFSNQDGTDLLVLESPEPWGPFSLVHYEEMWEGREFNPYCPRLPLKWIDSDGVTAWLQFSGNWGPEGQDAGYYRSNVRQFRLIMR